MTKQLQQITGGINVDFKKLYTMLFNSLTDAIELIETGDAEEAKAVLIAAQQKAEDAYIEDED